MGLAAALQRFAVVLAPQTPSIRLDFADYRSQAVALEERLVSDLSRGAVERDPPFRRATASTCAPRSTRTS